MWHTIMANVALGSLTIPGDFIAEFDTGRGREGGRRGLIF
jgi:hypothetical protein